MQAPTNATSTDALATKPAARRLGSVPPSVISDGAGERREQADPAPDDGGGHDVTRAGS